MSAFQSGLMDFSLRSEVLPQLSHPAAGTVRIRGIIYLLIQFPRLPFLRRRGGTMNARELAELTALIESIDDLLKQYYKETSLERIAALQAELTEATGRLKRVALSLQN